MIRSASAEDIDEADPEVGHPEDAAAGVTDLGVAMERTSEQLAEP